MNEIINCNYNSPIQTKQGQFITSFYSTNSTNRTSENPAVFTNFKNKISTRKLLLQVTRKKKPFVTVL